MPCNRSNTVAFTASAAGSVSSSRRSRGSANVSGVERQLLSAKAPIDVRETETITVNGETGVFVNRSEVAAFSGPVAISKYEIFNDPNPEIINKQVPAADCKPQLINVKYLQASAGSAGDIIINQDPSTATPAAPPVIIRQEADANCGGKSKTIREEPPCTGSLGPVTITVPGSSMAPPPRRVIVERLAAPPAGPGKVTVERWLAAPQGGERRVIFNAASNGSNGPVRNTIIEWSQPECDTETIVKSLGVKDANPSEYRERYGRKLKHVDDLPEFAQNVDAPAGTTFAVDAPEAAPLKLTGDVAALKFVSNLAEYGLEAYIPQVRAAGPAPGSAGESRRSARSARSAASSASGCGAPKPAKKSSCSKPAPKSRC